MAQFRYSGEQFKSELRSVDAPRGSNSAYFKIRVPLERGLYTAELDSRRDEELLDLKYDVQI